MAFSIAIRGPEWFFGIDSLFEGFAGLALLLVTLFSIKAYLFTKDKRYRSFAVAFGLMTVGLAAKAITDFLVHQKIGPSGVIFLYGYLAYIATTLTALVILFALTLKSQQRTPFIALLLVSLVLVLLSSSYFLSFHVISLILLVFITIHFVKNYYAKRSLSSLLVCIAFVLLAVGQLQFIVDIAYHKWYILGHLSHLLAYVLVLVALGKVLKKR